ncbi:hypothetical protein DEFDS_P029 (plasmid) [Deferribacter desulfuricans SSM1]|uniref:TraD/TraG TraM recognition site domain-containing protein n=1 Tax=Deferribacter desulfuricans (strain DSM 14783 / JCM 11476 / NBRC 101012 / SSM1) TaxID=639282 RepID=D3PEL5_DEFDS|nr:TraM recognition domain-containing protein [Deferribacter desulfuricans]BAI81657.1 hypothetical protein DEFDS_P029 [Deferribacter desulfuricans SSM1]
MAKKNRNFDPEERVKQTYEREVKKLRYKLKGQEKRLYFFLLYVVLLSSLASFLFFTVLLSFVFVALIPFIVKKIAQIDYSPVELLGVPDMPWYLRIGEDEFELPVAFPDNEIKRHMLCPGTTGSGKTSSIMYLCKNQIERGGGVLMVDGKSENPTWMDFYSLAKIYNRDDEIFLLSFKSGAFASSSTWNFLMEGSSPEIADMIINLAIGDTSSAGDNKVFMMRAMNLIKVALSALTYLRDVKGEVITLDDLIEIIHLEALIAVASPSIEQIPESSKQYAKYWIPNDYIEKGLTVPAKIPVITYLKSIGGDLDINRPLELDKMDRQLVESMKRQHSYAEMQFTEALNDFSNIYGKVFKAKYSDVFLSDIIKNNNLLYVLVPSLEKGEETKRSIGMMVVTAIRIACAKMLGDSPEGLREQLKKEELRKRARPAFLVILDEYGSYKTPGLNDIAAQARSLGISLLIAVQEFASLEVKGDAEQKNRILGNTVIKLVLRLEDSKTIKEIIEAAGKEVMMVEQSKQESNIRILDNVATKYREYSLREVDKLKVEDLRQLHDGYGYIMYNEKIRKIRTGYVKPKHPATFRLPKMTPKILLKNVIYNEFHINNYKDVDLLSIENLSLQNLKESNDINTIKDEDPKNTPFSRIRNIKNRNRGRRTNVI